MTDMSPEELREKAVRAMSEPPGTTGMLRIWGERLLALLDQNDALRARCAALEAALPHALGLAYDAGFADSGEGWNGEWPTSPEARTTPQYRDKRQMWIDLVLDPKDGIVGAALLPVPSAEPETRAEPAGEVDPGRMSDAPYEPRGCPTPGACSCVPAARELEELRKLAERAKHLLIIDAGDAEHPQTEEASKWVADYRALLARTAKP